MNDGGFGCYVHLPFCDRICPYCDFAVARMDRTLAVRYLRALENEIRRSSHRGALHTIFLGGGTPSALGAAAIEQILGSLFETFAVEPDAIECTLEANPSRNAGDLPALRAAGVNRLSIGVQSLDDGELHRLGRDHSAADALRYVDAAREAGFENISLDLIAGAPGQTAGSFAHTLHGAIGKDVEHVSVYGLTIEAGTPYATWHAREPAAFPDDDAVAELLSLARRTLVDAGYRHYELSNFARPGRECAHNIGYWCQRDCLAFGMSAAGFLDGERTRNARDLDGYCAAIEAGRSPVDRAERLDRQARIGEAAMLALRTSDGIDDEDFRRRFRIDTKVAFAVPRRECASTGLLEVDDTGVRLTERGKLLANDVCARFLDPAL
ncbi:MAG TPA: radical SAM family heme chaperone HemW [Candidatus Eremiobacteraceae bacterium]|nr:radical SAM family heme chaperone HemW [Candidatus Eremiobacteraceae bacterium]